MEKFKNFLSKIKYYRVICLSISFIFLIIGIILSVIVSSGANKYTDQTAAKRWDASGGSSHISLFIKGDAGFTKMSVEELEYNIVKKLDENSVEAANEDARRYMDCYMAKSSILLENENEIIDVDCMAVGGDFFSFHPVKLLCGSYFNDEDLSKDGIILDEKTAWDLFGSYDVEGKKVLYGDRVLFIKGVYRPEDNKIYNYARGEKSEIFVPFDLINSEDHPLDIICVEYCLPNPIKNFASKIVTDSMKLDTSLYEMTENSARYTIGNLWKINKDKRFRSMQNKDIIYPYWEKIARYEEELLAPKAVFMCISYITSGIVFLAMVLYDISKLTKLKIRNDD